MSPTPFFKKNFSPIYSLVSCLTASLIFGFSYIDMNIMSSISGLLLREGIFTPTQFGMLVSIYFWANCLVYIPAGCLVSRLSFRKIILLTTLCLCVGNLLLLFENIFFFGFGRLILGIAGSFSYLLALSLAYSFVNTSFLGLAFGLISTIGLIGGFLSQGPLLILISQYGWENSILTMIVVIILLGIINFTTLKKEHDLKKISETTTFNSLKREVFNQFKTKALWVYAFYALLMCTPIFLLTSSWGQEYLKLFDKFSEEDAAMINGMIFIGVMLGAPLWGVLENAKFSRYSMLAGATLSFFTLLIVLSYISVISVNLAYLVYFLLGLFISAQILAYSRLAKHSNENLGVTIGALVTLVVAGGAVIQFVFNTLLKILPLSSALWVIPAFILLAFLIGLFGKLENENARSIN